MFVYRSVYSNDWIGILFEKKIGGGKINLKNICIIQKKVVILQVVYYAPIYAMLCTRAYVREIQEFLAIIMNKLIIITK